MQRNNPEQSRLPMHRSPRCGARTRKGAPCQSPAVRGKLRCRMHGGKATGAPHGNRNAWKHGVYSRDALEERRQLRALIRELRQSLEVLN